MAGSGGMTKAGTGMLTLSGLSTYTGGTVVNAGKLVLVNTGNSGTTRISGALTVNSGGTVETNNGDVTGLGWNGQVTSVTINGGMVNFTTKGHVWGIPGGVTMTGGTLRSNDGVNLPGSGADGGQIEWNKTNVTTLASPQTATIAGKIRIRSDNAETGIVFDVADGTASTDLLVSAGIGQSGGNMAITKSGAGLMELSGTNTYGGATTVNAGTLVITGRIAGNSFNLKDDTNLTVKANGATPAIACTGAVTIGYEPTTTNVVNFSDLSSSTVAPITGNAVYLDSPVTVNIASVAPVVGRYPLIKTSGSWFVTSRLLARFPAVSPPAWWTTAPTPARSIWM